MIIQIIKTIRRSLLKFAVPEFVWPKKVNIGGQSILIRGTPYSFGVKRLLSFFPDQYEKEERFYLQYLNEDEIVIEMGGSIGILTSLISNKIGDGGKLISIEADNEIVNYSKNWLEKLGNVMVLNKLAFPIYNRINLIASFNNESGSLGGRVTFSEAEIGAKEELDNHFFIVDMFESYGLNPDVLIIDVEGSEEIMINHKPNYPNSINKIFIELHPNIYGISKQIQIINRIKAENFILHSSISDVFYFRRIRQNTQ